MYTGLGISQNWSTGQASRQPQHVKVVVNYYNMYDVEDKTSHTAVMVRGGRERSKWDSRKLFIGAQDR
jgi:hypothetical protein